MSISSSVGDTGRIASKFIEDTEPKKNSATVVGLSGELGSGKTTFVKAIAKALGVEEVVTSPTFVIEKIYKIEHPKFSRLIHIDAYRLDGGKELLSLGWDDISSDKKNLIFIEWPENVSDVVPKDATKISFEHVSENERKITTE